MDIEKVKKLSGHAVLFTGYRTDGAHLINVKINGAVKRWKREPDRVEVPVKYGLYECARIKYRHGVMEDTNLYFVELIDE